MSATYLFETRYVLVPFVRSMVSRCAPVPAKMAKMSRTRQLSCATCAAWRKVSGRLRTHAVVILSLSSVIYDIGVLLSY